MIVYINNGTLQIRQYDIRYKSFFEFDYQVDATLTIPIIAC